jgi:CelD/BcsL family acetyltransferase involved in cellulose biosynthesis
MSIRHKTKKDTEILTENFSSLANFWKDSKIGVNWPQVFVLPDWLDTWYTVFGNGEIPFMFSIRGQGRLAGIAPLMIQGRTAAFMGDPEICDYFDFIVAPEMGDFFCQSFLDYLIEHNILELDLRCLRPDSFALTEMVPAILKRGFTAVCEPDGTSVEVALPQTWDEYLAALDQKQRHEVRRKLRRLQEAGDVRFTVYDRSEDIRHHLDVFFTLFRESRTDKTQFMTLQMERFFNVMLFRIADLGLLRMGTLCVNGHPAAVVLAFDYKDRIYLYNNGYDPAYASLSVGVLSKVLLLQYAIEGKKKIFDFLKGDETYKYRLGGREVALSRLRVKLS